MERAKKKTKTKKEEIKVGTLLSNNTCVYDQLRDPEHVSLQRVCKLHRSLACKPRDFFFFSPFIFKVMGRPLLLARLPKNFTRLSPINAHTQLSQWGFVDGDAIRLAVCCALGHHTYFTNAFRFPSILLVIREWRSLYRAVARTSN